MLNKMPFKRASLALGSALIAGCQSTATQQPTVAATEKPAATQVTQQSSEQATKNMLTVYLAQQQAEPDLLVLDLGENTKLYALPQPVLTQSDMLSFAPVQSEEGQTFLLFEMNDAGKEKLAAISTQAVGHFFLFSARGQLVGIAKIDGPVSNGQLLMATKNEKHAAEIMQLMR